MCMESKHFVRNETALIICLRLRPLNPAFCTAIKLPQFGTKNAYVPA